MSTYTCKECREEVEENELMEHLMDKHDQDYADQIEKLVQKYFG